MITIDWGTKVITVPKSFLTLVQSNPIEILNLDLNQFRLALKELEASVAGMPELRTHTHNTEVFLGGIVYARVIEIINGYTVTFEDGAYAVNLIGANSNVGDVINFNQVSVRSTNAAGLISNAAIEFASFNGGVTVDDNSPDAGTVFPIGTPQRPVNNIPDAVLIAQRRGFDRIFIIGDIILDTGDILSDYALEGNGVNRSFITVLPGAVVDNIEIQWATVTGTFDGKASFKDSTLEDINFVEAEILNCTLTGTIVLSGNGSTNIENSRDGLLASATAPVIDFNGTGHNLGIRGYDGDINLKNKTGLGDVEINMATGGRVTLESTVTAGRIRLTGALELIDNSTGTAEVNSKQVVFPSLQQLSSFKGAVSIHPGSAFSGVKFPVGTHEFPVNNLADAILIAEDRGIRAFQVQETLLISDTDISGYTFIGENALSSVVVLQGAGNTTTRTTFRNLITVGRLNGAVLMENCGLQTLSNVGSTDFPSVFSECILRADSGATPAIQLKENGVGIQNVHFIQCVSGVPGDTPVTIDVNNSDAPIAFRKYGGGLSIRNYTEGQASTIEVTEGQVSIEASCTQGVIQFRGGGIIKEYPTNPNLVLVVDANYGGNVNEIHKLMGLNKDHEVTLTKTSTSVDNINLDMTGDGQNIIILNRT